MDSEEVVENIGLTKALYEEIGEVITLEETSVDLIGSLEKVMFEKLMEEYL